MLYYGMVRIHKKTNRMVFGLHIHTCEFVPLTHIYYHALSWLGTGIWIKGGEVNSFILFYAFIYIWEILTFWSEKVVIKYFINKSHNYKISVLLISWFNSYQTNVPTLKASYRIPKQKRLILCKASRKTEVIRNMTKNIKRLSLFSRR